MYKKLYDYFRVIFKQAKVSGFSRYCSRTVDKKAQFLDWQILKNKNTAKKKKLGWYNV